MRGPTGCRYLADDRQKNYVRDGWNLTGDAFAQDADGYFHFVARTDDMIISSGYNIAGPEVEAALLSHPDVKECAVIGVPDEERGQIVQAHVVLRSDVAARCGDCAQAAGSRQGDDRAVQISAVGEIHRRAAEDADRKDPALPAAAREQSANAGARRMSNRTRRIEFLHPRNWKRARGYANGVAAEGRMVFVAGQIGWNAEQQFESQDFVAQIRQALENIVASCKRRAARPEHVTRLTWFVTDKTEYLSRLPEVGEAYRGVMGKHFPAMTMVQVSALIEDDAKVEIEASAIVPHI